MNDVQAALYDAIAGGDRGRDSAFRLTEADGSLVGPFNSLLYCPSVGDAVQRLGAAIRFHSELPPRVREIAILAVARHWRSDFEWWAHEPIARRAGLSETHLTDIRQGRPVRFDDRAEQAAHDLCRSLLDTGAVSDELYEAAVSEHGESGVCTLLILIGYYGLLAQMMSALRVGVPDGQSPVFTAEPG